MADAHADVKHQYHLVDASIWPLTGAVGAFMLALGAVLQWHGITGDWLWILGGLVTAYTMFVWWRDVVKEAHVGDHTPVVSLGLRYGMILFIVSEVMFFFAWFWAYFHASLYPTEFVGSQWPPVGIETFDPWHLPFINTLILLLSGTTVTWAHHALMDGNRKGLKQGLWCTVLLGLLFTCIQGYEYSHAAYGFTDGIYASTFYMATGFHGFHVIVGTIFLTVNLIRAYRGHFRPDKHFGFEAAAWYWHFVDFVWIFLFLSIYVGSGYTGTH